MINQVVELMDGVFGNIWRKMLLSMASDDASNMIGSHQGAVARFEQIPVEGAFLVWCAAHEIYLLIQ